MSLYHHIDGKEALLDGLVGRRHQRSIDTTDPPPGHTAHVVT